MALEFLERYTVHADHPALAASCRRHGWESLHDLLRSQEVVSAEGLAAVGVSTSLAVQKILHELRKLSPSAKRTTRRAYSRPRAGLRAPVRTLPGCVLLSSAAKPLVRRRHGCPLER